jgi:hypothetical protein
VSSSNSLIWKRLAMAGRPLLPQKRAISRGSSPSRSALVLQLDDLIQSGAKQITVPRRLRLLWSHRSLSCTGITPIREKISNMKLQATEASTLQKNRRRRQKPIPLNGLGSCSRTT